MYFDGKTIENKLLGQQKPSATLAKWDSAEFPKKLFHHRTGLKQTTKMVKIHHCCQKNRIETPTGCLLVTTKGQRHLSLQLYDENVIRWQNLIEINWSKVTAPWGQLPPCNCKWKKGANIVVQPTLGSIIYNIS